MTDRAAPSPVVFGELTRHVVRVGEVLVEVSAVDAEPGALAEMTEYLCALLVPVSDQVEEPEFVLLDALAHEHAIDPALLKLPLVADLVAVALLAKARGACMNVGSHVRVTGVPPRPDGWLVDLTDGQQLGVIEGGIAELVMPQAGHVVAIAPSAYEAAVAARRPDPFDSGDGVEVWQRAATGEVARTPGFASFCRTRHR